MHHNVVVDDDDDGKNSLSKIENCAPPDMQIAAIINPPTPRVVCMSIVTHLVTGARFNSGTKQHSGGVRREKVCESVDLISASSPSTYCMHKLEWGDKNKWEKSRNYD